MDGLKQRVIGALVLVSLAVIFVPMLFDEPHTERSSKRIDLPEEPPFPAVEAPAPVKPDEPPSSSYRIEEPSKNAASILDTPAETSQPASMADEPAGSAGQNVPAPDTQRDAGSAMAESSPAPDSTESSGADEEFSGSLKGAWLVQLGSFGNPDNAVRLRNSVREKGYDSHIQKVVRGDTTLTRVFSGPFAEKSEAERAKKRLDSEFGVNGLVTSGDQ